ncbi:MAG: outer membrane protein assembly factor BamD [Gemmatimonadales bacterium]
MKPSTCRVLLILLGATACGGGNPETTPAPATNLVATPEKLDSLWNEAVAEFTDRDWRNAGILFERLMLELPRRDPRQPMARLSLGEARLGQKSYLQAVREFRRVADEYPNDSLAPVGLLRAGDAYAKLWRRPELDPTYGGQAVATWQELLTRYPQSAYADTARTRIAGLNEWYAIKEYKAASFYMRYKLYDSAILYLKDLVATYPRTAQAPRAMASLVAAYRKLGYVEDVQEMCTFYRTNYPDAEGLAESCPAPQVADGGAGTPPGS